MTDQNSSLITNQLLVHHLSWIMELFIKASGLKKVFVKVKVFNSGKMAASMKVIGKMIKLMVMDG